MTFEQADYCPRDGATMIAELNDSNIVKCPVCGRIDLKRNRRTEDGGNYRKEGR